MTDKTRGYRYPHCKSCMAQMKREQRKANPEAYNQYQREYYRKNSEALKPMYARANAKSYQKMKQEIIECLGGVCAVCGIDFALQIDHVQGGGRAHRRSLGHFGSLRDIRNTCRSGGDVSGYQVLCANHHHLKTVREISR